MFINIGSSCTQKVTMYAATLYYFLEVHMEALTGHVYWLVSVPDM